MEDEKIKLSISISSETHTKLLKYMNRHRIYNKSRVINKIIDDYFLPNLQSLNSDTKSDTNLDSLNNAVSTTKTNTLNGNRFEKDMFELQKDKVFVSSNNYVIVDIPYLTKMHKLKFIFYLLRLKKVLKFMKKDL